MRNKASYLAADSWLPFDNLHLHSARMITHLPLAWIAFWLRSFQLATATVLLSLGSRVWAGKCSCERQESFPSFSVLKTEPKHSHTISILNKEKGNEVSNARVCAAGGFDYIFVTGIRSSFWMLFRNMSIMGFGTFFSPEQSP